MSTSIQPAPPQAGAFDDLIPKGAGGQTGGGGAFDDLIPHQDLFQATAQAMGHGLLSTPAAIVGLPAATSRLLSHYPTSAPGGAAVGTMGALAGAVGNAVEPLRAGLQQVADEVAPMPTDQDLGPTAHPTARHALLGAADIGGGMLGGAIGGGLLGKAASLLSSAAPETRLASAVTAGLGDVPAGASAVTPTTMPADLAPELASWARRQSPAAARVIEGGLKARAAQQYPQIAQALQDATGENVGTLSTDIPQQISTMKAAAAPHYDAAYAAPDITDPAFVKQFQSLASTPGGQQAYATAERIAQAEGNPIPALPKGNGQPKWMQQMADVLGRDPTPQEIALAQAHNPGLAAQGAPGIGVRTLDLFKRGMDDVIAQRGDATATLGRQEGRALQSRLAPLLQQADQLVPEYGAARSTASQGFGLDDAASQARKDFSSANAATPEEVSQRVTTLPAPEKRIYTQAALDQTLTNLASTTGSATGRADLASKLWSSIGGRGKLAALIGDPQKADALGQAMENLASQQETMRSVTGGSQTAEKFAADQRFGNALGAAHEVMGAIGGNPLAALKLAGRAGAALGRNTAARDAERLAPLLVQQGPDVLGALNQAAASRAAQAAAIRRLPAVAGAGAGGGAQVP